MSCRATRNILKLHIVTKQGKGEAMSKRRIIGALLGSATVFLFGATSASGTYSIAACDAKAHECGVAVQTNNLAVGASVPYAQAGVGALVSQFETNPHYGPRGLTLLAQGTSPEETLKRLLGEDGNFDGEGVEARQVALVSIDGRTASYTGEQALHAEWAGVRSGPGYTVQGNGLVGANVVEAMERVFLKTEGTLAEKLMAALMAGDLAGGQKTGRESAALLVRTAEGWPFDIDLRVDHSRDPVGELKDLFDMQAARQQMIQANILARRGQLEQARSLLIGAVGRASNWSRIWIRAARVAEEMEEPILALQYLTVAFSQNPAWVQTEIGDGNYPDLGASPQFHRWVSPEQEKSVLAAYQDLSQMKETAIERRIQVTRALLEIGHVDEALVVLNGMSESSDKSVDLRLLRSAAFAAKRDYSDAIEECNAALRKAPNDQRVRRRMARLELETKAQVNR